MTYRRGIHVRAECRDATGRLLLVPSAADRADLPGGPVGHGEHPADALVRWAAGQSLPALAIGRPLRVVTDVDRSPLAPGSASDRRGWVHSDTIVYSADAGDAHFEPAPSSGARWVAADEVATLALAPAAAAVLGLVTARRRPRRVPWAAVPGIDGRRQRFAAYGHVTDPAGNVLLTRIAAGYPGAGLWHLPGGGTDFGEPAPAGLYREIVEETGQHGQIGELLRVSHRHQRHSPDGRPLDWHGVRVVYAVRVEQPGPPQVLERGGSTAAAAWFAPARALELDLTEVAREALTARQPAAG